MARVPTILLRLLLPASAILGCLLIVALGETPPAGDLPQYIALPYSGTFLFLVVTAFALRAGNDESDPGRTDNSLRGKISGAGSVTGLTVFALTLIGFALRIGHLNRFGLCNDEAFFVAAAGHPDFWDAMRDSLRHFHPPTNFIMLHYLLKVSWNPVWIRLPSVIGGTLAIYFTFVLVRDLFGRRAGLIAAFFVTFSPNLILLSQVCRNYSPSLPFFLLSATYFSRYLRNGKTREIYGFSLFEFLSVIWHYAYLPAFLGLNVVLFARLAAERRPLREWAASVYSQLPVGVVYSFALFIHLPMTGTDTQLKILRYMTDEYYLSLSNPLRPIVAIYEYLASGGEGIRGFVLGGILFAAAVFACIYLARKGFGWQVAASLSLLPFAYGFAFVVHLLPLGGTRHSFYTFPFAFGLSAAGLSTFLSIGRSTVDGTDPNMEEPAEPVLRPLNSFMVVLFCGVYLFSSLTLYSDVTPYYLRRSPVDDENTPYYRANFYKIVELPTRVQDIELLSTSLLAHSKPGDFVVMSFPSYVILMAYLEERPNPPFYDLSQGAQFTWNERRFVYVPEAGLGFTPDSLLITVAALARREGLGDTARVWVATAGWETWPFALRRWSEIAYPGWVVQDGSAQDSGETLFAVTAGEARSDTQGVLEFGRGRAEGN